MQKRRPYREIVERAVFQMPQWSGVIGVGLLILLQVPWLDTPLNLIGIRDSDTFRTIVVTLVLTGMLLEMRELGRTVRSHEMRQHFADPRDMYQFMLKRADGITSRRKRQLDVLGLTLYSAWPTISFWLQQTTLRDWTIRFATLKSSGSAAHAWVPDDWPSESAANVSAIRKFVESASLEQRRISIEIAEYDFVPGIHGFRLGNGDVFISSLLWQEDRRLGKPGFSYEYVPASDDSVGAIALRRLFDNWFDRAMHHAVAPAPAGVAGGE